jgi:hypothetical protein
MGKIKARTGKCQRANAHKNAGNALERQQRYVVLMGQSSTPCMLVLPVQYQADETNKGFMPQLKCFERVDHRQGKGKGRERNAEPACGIMRSLGAPFW